MQAIYKGEVIAESDETVVVEGNHYFPIGAVRPDHIRSSVHTSVCPWKGTASYYDVVAGADASANAAWYYPEPKTEAAHIKGHVAFWKDVEVQ